jgi:peptide deformylase
MAKREILQLGDPTLHVVCAGVDARDPSSMQLVRDLADTLSAFREQHGFGRAIAAPQVGALARVIVVRVPDGFGAALHNPTIDARSDDTFGCGTIASAFPS